MEAIKHYIPEAYKPREEVTGFGCAEPYSCDVCRDEVPLIYGYVHPTKLYIWVCEPCHKADINKEVVLDDLS